MRSSQKSCALLDKTPDDRLQQFEKLGTDLIKDDIWPLELGSTILFFYAQNSNWEDAFASACQFKNAAAANGASQNALALARRVATHSEQQ